MRIFVRLAALCFGLILSAPLAFAEEVRVAVASNFVPALEALAGPFERQTGHRVLLSAGSTGKHYAQIRRGAPFDLFLAADRARPERLELAGLGVADSRFTYALGVLVLWRPDGPLPDPPPAALSDETGGRLAMANPALAPYGRAARQTLERLGVWESVRARRVRGENIAQAYQFVATGNAALGLVALSQYRQRPEGGVWEIPERLYEPIEQQALLLRESPGARALWRYLRSEPARQRIRELGYRLPD